MSPEIMKYILFIGAVVAFFIFLRDFIPMLFGVNDVELHNTRMKQLDFANERVRNGKSKTEEEEIRKLINDITTPLIKHVMPNIEYRKDLDSLEKNLKFAGFDKYFTASQYIALIIAGRFAGLFAFIVFFPFAKPIAFLWLFALGIFPSFLFKNSVNNKKEVLLMGFPEFINISKSYLASGMTFEKAVEESIMYVNKEWQELLKRYLINSETLSRRECLTILAEESNIFEINEFMSLVQLNMEQGIDVKDSFERQYGKIKDLQNLAIVKKIEGRKVWTVLVQGPVLLTILVAFGLPTFESMMGMGSLM